MTTGWTKLFMTLLVCSTTWMESAVTCAKAGQSPYWSRNPRNVASSRYDVDDEYDVTHILGCKSSRQDPDGDCIPGNGGTDYPTFANVPSTGFSCSDYQHQGYFADIDTFCQVFHICEWDGRQHSILCPKGTIFNQEVLVCDWWYNVDCYKSLELYANIYADDQMYSQYDAGDHEDGPYFDDPIYTNRRSDVTVEAANATVSDAAVVTSHVTAATKKRSNGGKFPTYTQMKSKKDLNKSKFGAKQKPSKKA